MIKLYVLFVVSWLVVGTIAMETKMGAWHNPFDCPLSYDSLSVLGGSDKKMLKQRRRADRIVRVRENRAKAVAHRKKSMKAAWGVAPKKQETDGSFKTRVHNWEDFGPDEMEAFMMYTGDY